MLSEEAQEELLKQSYKLIGSHSAVKTCGWTKKMLKGEGGCYKLKFYGIMSNQCMQMTTSISCANRCSFCWRGYKAPVAKEWKWVVDDPWMILEKSQEAHHEQLKGFGGHPRLQEGAYRKSKQVRHVALSLTGEPIIYPRMNDLVDLFHQNNISTFLVTNAQYPDEIKNLKPLTQLYISLDAPTKELLKQVDVPLFPDYWERLLESLDAMAQKPERTCIRMTMIKNINTHDWDKYAQLIHRADPDFLEVKAYMHVGASQQRLKRENMPLHEEIVEYTKQLLAHLPDYDIVAEHIPSRVVCIAKKSYCRGGQWYTWIDFTKFHALANGGEPFTAQDYLRRTPITGLSGKGTLTKGAPKVDEKTPELELDA